jgi:hypothetical protein
MKKILVILMVLIPVISLFAQSVLKITPGTTLKTTNNAFIVLNNASLNNNGIIQQPINSGTFKFTGDNDDTVKGNGDFYLDRIHLLKNSGGSLILKTNIQVGSEFNFDGGKLDLDNYILDLGYTGLLANESETNRASTNATGHIRVARILNSPNEINPGNLGAIITSAANLDTTIIRRGHAVQMNLYNSNNSIQRFYEIVPKNNDLLNSTLKFQYFDAELDGINESSLSLWKSSDQISWMPSGHDARDVNSNYVLRNGINDFSRWTLSPASPISIELISQTEIACYGDNSGAIDISVAGGSGSYTYLWSNGQATEDINDLQAGVYTVMVTDGDGSTAQASYEITQPAELTAIAMGTSNSCTNSATVVANGGTGSYTYLWSNGATTQSITSIPAGTYAVTITDANGCMTTASCSVTANQAFNPSASVVDVSCYGGSNGSITVTNANGTAPFQYSINGGLSYQSNNTFSGLTAGTYTITVVDANGCTGFVTKTIIQPSPLIVNINNVQSSCYGSSTGSINLSVSGGSPSYSYLWSGPNSYASTQLNISNLATGSYMLTLNDNKGCTSIKNVFVPSYNQVIINSIVTNIACKGELTGAIDITVSGGSGSGFNYLWTGPPGYSSITEDLNNLGTGNYNLSVTDPASGCIVTSSYVITQPATAVSLSTTKTNATGCNSLGSITATGSGGTPGYTYKLNNESYQSSGLFTGLYAGTYTVWVKDANGCTKSSTVSITDNGSDEFESNNSKNQAKTISVGATNRARLALSTDIADWFKFTTTSAGSYTLTLTHPTLGFTFDMYTSVNNTPGLIPTTTTATAKTYTVAANTTYYISVTGGLSYVCYQFSVAPSSFLTKSAGSIIQQEELKSAKKIDIFNVSAYPNPSGNYFTLRIETSSDEKIDLRVLDVTGRLIEEKKNVSASDILKLGERYINGVYVVEVTQANKRSTLKLIKM